MRTTTNQLPTTMPERPRAAARCGSGSRAPYTVGETVTGMWLDPHTGTVASAGTVTACVWREDGDGWGLEVVFRDGHSETYRLGRSGHCDYVGRPFPPA